MSDMIAIFGVLLIMGLGFPALLLLVWLSFPPAVERARQRVAQTPLRCVWFGLAIALLITLPTMALLNIPGPGQFLGSLLLLVSLTGSIVGAAGVAAHLGARLGTRNQRAMNTHTGFLYGAITLELAVAFPVIGWLIMLPIMFLLALGATGFALLHWRPKPAPAPHSLPQEQAA